MSESLPRNLVLENWEFGQFSPIEMMRSILMCSFESILDGPGQHFWLCTPSGAYRYLLEAKIAEGFPPLIMLYEVEPSAASSIPGKKKCLVARFANKPGGYSFHPEIREWAFFVILLSKR